MTDRNRTGSRTKRLVTHLCLGLLLAGCPSPTPPEPTTPAPVEPAAPEPGGTLVVGYQADLDGFNPVVQSSDLGGQILDFLFPLLLMPTFDGALGYEPHLAREWSFSEDGLTLTLVLRDDVAWSDGAPITAADVTFTLDLVRDEAVGSPYHSQVEHVADVSAADDHTVEIRFDHAYDRTTMLSHAVGCPIVPHHALEDVPRTDLRGAAFDAAPVTAGAFRLDRWDRNQEVVLVRDEGERPTPPAHLGRVVFRIIPEYTTRLVELGNGTIDVLPGLQVEDVARLREEHPEIEVARRGKRFLDYIAWNLADDRFADVRVRRAMAHAIDVDALIATLLSAGGETYASRAVGSVSPELKGVGQPDIEPLAHDPAAARQLLAEAGWTDTDGDGVVDREGAPLSFTLSTNAGNPRREQAQLILQDQLRQVGVDVKIDRLEGNVFYERLREHKFEAALAGWGSSLFVDPSRKWGSGAVYNYPSYSNPRVDELIAEGTATTDPAAAQRCWLELQQQVYADQPYCFLYWREELVAVHSRVRDAGISTLWLFEDLHAWWIPKAEQGR